MKYFIIAGEASGDLHGANLINEIKKIDSTVEIHCWGGNLMQASGAKVLKHISELAFMGFIEVLKNIIAITKNFALCKKQISEFEPDAIIFIDYPGFNLRMAKWAFFKKYKTIYYISPQIWAWKENRVYKIKKYVHTMICILPFEKQFYAKYNYNVHYVGNPLMYEIEKFKQENINLLKANNGIKNIAILPGSRLQEVNTKLPLMLSVLEHFPQYNFIIAQAPNLPTIAYEPFIKKYPNVQLVQNNTYAILMQSHAALVTSGTATLETALFGVPQVVCYIGNNISYAIGKHLIKVPYISLVNLICNKKIVTELIQNNLTPQNILQALQQVLNSSNREVILENYKTLFTKIGNSNASLQAAKIICASTNN